MKKILLIALFIVNYAIAFSQNVGIGTTTPQARLHVADSNVLFSGHISGDVFINSSPLPVSGSGIRMMWIPTNAAFRVGAAISDEWDKQYIGNYSFAAGGGTKASGLSSTATGEGTIATGNYSVALGSNNTASGYASTALGNITKAYGENATSIGNNTFANGFSSLAIGMFNDSIVLREQAITPTTPLFIIGNGNAENNRKNAMVVLKSGNTGIGTIAPQARLHVADSAVVFTGPATLPANPGNPPISGAGSRMMWYPDKASFRVGGVSGDLWDKEKVGRFSFASGNNSEAPGIYSTAMGQSTRANGWASTAMGYLSYASGEASTTMGSDTRAIGSSSTAMGHFTRARGDASTAMGDYTDANGFSSLVAGTFNDTLVPIQTFVTPTTPLFIIGNGDNVVSRSNAIAVLKNGNVAIGNNPTPVNRLHITGGTNLSLSDNSGYMTLGPTNSSNMVFDNNEIQVRNNGAATNLYLQTNGGKVIIGSGAASSHLLTVSGNAYKTSGSSAWEIPSDARLKKDIKPYEDGLASILKIKPVWFTYNEMSGFDTQHLNVGILAQELQKISPYMVSESSTRKAPDGSSSLEVDNGAMTYMLINAVKEQQQIIEELKVQQKTQFEMLQKEIQALKSKINKK